MIYYTVNQSKGKKLYNVPTQDKSIYFSVQIRGKELRFLNNHYYRNSSPCQLFLSHHWSTKRVFHGNLKFMPVYCNDLGCNMSQFSSSFGFSGAISAMSVPNSERKWSLSPPPGCPTCILRVSQIFSLSSACNLPHQQILWISRNHHPKSQSLTQIHWNYAARYKEATEFFQIIIGLQVFPLKRDVWKMHSAE